MARALALQGGSLLGVLASDGMHYADDAAEFETLLMHHPDATLLHNQNEEAMRAIEQIEHVDGQRSIEVFQDTEGVFGLRAYRMEGKLQTPITLEFRDE